MGSNNHRKKVNWKKDVQKFCFKKLLIKQGKRPSKKEVFFCKNPLSKWNW